MSLIVKKIKVKSVLTRSEIPGVDYIVNEFCDIVDIVKL